MSDEKFVLIRPPSMVDEALRTAARRRQISKVDLIERLLTIVTTDKLIDAVLDDDRGGEWTDTIQTLPT